MKKTMLINLSLFYVSMLIIASAQAETPIYSEQAISKITIFPVSADGRGKKTIKDETRFIESNWKGLLFTIRTLSTSYEGLDGSEDFSTITARKIGSNASSNKKIWVQEAPGLDFAIESYGDEFVSLSQYGCCDEPTIKRVFNMETGEKVEATLNETLLVVEAPNSKLNRRYLATVLDSKAPKMLGNKSYMGTVSYFDKDKIKGRVRIYAALPSGWASDIVEFKGISLSGANSKNQISDKKIMLWDTDGNKDAVLAYDNFGVEGSLYYNDRHEIFSIAISKDAMDPNRSTKTSDIELVFVQ